MPASSGCLVIFVAVFAFALAEDNRGGTSSLESRLENLLKVEIDGVPHHLKYDPHSDDAAALEQRARDFAGARGLDSELLIRQTLPIFQYVVWRARQYNDIHEFWETCDETFAHNSYGSYLESKDALIAEWRCTAPKARLPRIYFALTPTESPTLLRNSRIASLHLEPRRVIPH